MRGNNKPRGREHGDNIQVHDVFHTIQGEGPFSGLRAAFIRLTGCNLRCWFCDTNWDDDADPYQTPAEIAARARAEAPDTALAVITGGEPCRQDLDKLISHLNIQGFCNVQVETAGTFWQPCLEWGGVHVVVSPKTSKVRKEFYGHPKRPCVKVSWKYVIREGDVGDDGLPIGSMQAGGKGGMVARPPKGAYVYLQPCDEHDVVRNTCNSMEMVESALKHGYRAGIQLHKYLGLE